MSLYIYDVPDPQAAFSDDGDFTNPIALTFEGGAGGIVKQKMYIRNNNIAINYTSITITPIDGGDDLVDGSAGFGWKLIAGDTEPLEEQWGSITAGNSIDIPNISDTTTYQPFWIRVEVPAGAAISSFQSVQLKINATGT